MDNSHSGVINKEKHLSNLYDVDIANKTAKRNSEAFRYKQKDLSLSGLGAMTPLSASSVLDANIGINPKISTPKYMNKGISAQSPLNANTPKEESNIKAAISNNPNLNTNKKVETINVMSLFNSSHIPLTINTLKQNFANYDSSKHSTKAISHLKAYSANTHQGTVRNYNEDRVSIILNVVKPNSFAGDYWPKCSIFGIFDGHGGNLCADFLKDNLHQYVIKDINFPNNPREAITRGFEAAEKEFLNNYAIGKNGEVLDRSGSCAIVLFVIGKIIITLNR